MIHQHTLDLTNKLHARAFMVSVGHHLSGWPEDASARDIFEYLDVGDCDDLHDDISVWEPFEDYPIEDLLGFILSLTLDILNFKLTTEEPGPSQDPALVG